MKKIYKKKIKKNKKIFKNQTIQKLPMVLKVTVSPSSSPSSCLPLHQWQGTKWTWIASVPPALDCTLAYCAILYSTELQYTALCYAVNWTVEMSVSSIFYAQTGMAQRMECTFRFQIEKLPKATENTAKNENISFLFGFEGGGYSSGHCPTPCIQSEASGRLQKKNH